MTVRCVSRFLRTPTPWRSLPPYGNGCHVSRRRSDGVRTVRRSRSRNSWVAPASRIWDVGTDLDRYRRTPNGECGCTGAGWSFPSLAIPAKAPGALPPGTQNAAVTGHVLVCPPWNSAWAWRRMTSRSPTSPTAGARVDRTARSPCTGPSCSFHHRLWTWCWYTNCVTSDSRATGLPSVGRCGSYCQMSTSERGGSPRKNRGFGGGGSSRTNHSLVKFGAMTDGEAVPHGHGRPSLGSDLFEYGAGCWWVLQGGRRRPP
jgi:hypothetical protein